MRRHTLTLVGVAVATITTVACGAKPPTPAPAPQADHAAADSARRATEERARRDADELARREAEERARREAEEQARARAWSTLGEMIFYDYDRADIRPEFRQVLERKAEILRNDHTIRLRIEGHADERGSDEYNLALGMRRAMAARDFLVRLGIASSQLDVGSWGEERPLVTQQNETAWSRNRRSEFIPSGGHRQAAP